MHFPLQMLTDLSLHGKRIAIDARMAGYCTVGRLERAFLHRGIDDEWGKRIAIGGVLGDWGFAESLDAKSITVNVAC